MGDLVERWVAQGREYTKYRDKFVKRSLSPGEYNERISNPDHYSTVNMTRLKNEAECIEFIKMNTTIPVPEVVAAYERDGSFFLETKLIDGVLMRDLKPEEQLEVMPQIRKCLQMLRGLRSARLGGPSGIIFPPQAIVSRPDGPKSWSQANISTSDLVFCHRDLSRSNIFFHPTTLRLVAIGDWEYGGFYPESLELPFFERSEKSGVQVKKISGIKEIKEFWEKAAC